MNELRKPTEGHVDLRRIIRTQKYMELNEKILRLTEKESKNKTVEVFGKHNGVGFQLKLKGSEIDGNYRNEVYWPVGSLQEWHQKLVGGLQMMGKGMISRWDLLEQLEYEDPQGYLDRVEDEKRKDVKLSIELTALQTDAALKQQEKQMALEAKNAPPAQAPVGGQVPQAGPGVASGAPPEGGPMPASPFSDMVARLKGNNAEPNEAETGAGQKHGDIFTGLEEKRVLDKGGMPQETAPAGRPFESAPIQLEEIKAALSSVPKLVSHVWLTGDIVTKGFAAKVDIVLWDLIDKQTIINALPQYKGRMNFRKGQPTGPTVKIR